MTVNQLNRAMGALRWNDATLARAVGASASQVGKWRAGTARVPDDIGEWLAAVSAALLANPAPQFNRGRPAA